jgi:uncharacterized protein YmfQ (DUF2313 family)
MADRHVRRSGDDYAVGMSNLLPQGLAWPRWSNTVLQNVVKGLAQIWGYVDGRAADLLERESDPRLTVELLPDWERNWGLPDPCYSAPQTVAERQLALVMRMTMQGGASRQFFINIAAQLGYTISITEYRPFFVAMDGCGDCRVYGFTPPTPMRNQWGQPILNAKGDAPVVNGQLSAWPNYGLGDITTRYFWTVHVSATKLIWFRCASGQCGVDPHLRIGIADDLECVLNRWKPAHTHIIFDYSSLGTNIVPPAQGLHVTPYAPIVANVGAPGLSPPRRSLVLTATAPSFSFAQLPKNISPPRALLSDTLYAPIMSIGTGVTISPPSLALSDTQYTPIVTIAAVSPNIAPPKATVNLMGRTPLMGGQFMPAAARLSILQSGTQSVPVTFDPGHVSQYITLSNGNLTATNPSANQPGNVLATAHAPSGKFYYEFTANLVNNDGIGLANATEARDNVVGSTANSLANNMAAQWVFNGANLATSGVTLTTGHVYAMAIDVTNQLAWCKDLTAGGNWNQNSSANPATGVGGASFAGITGDIYPCFGVYWTNGQYTANFGATAYTGTLPSGYTNWGATTTVSYAPIVTVTTGGAATLIWADEFDSYPSVAVGTTSDPNAVNDTTSNWRYVAEWQGANHGYRDFAGTSWNINPNDPNYAGYNPFSVSGSVLTIQVFRTPTALVAPIRADLIAQGNGGLADPAWCGGLMWTNFYKRTFKYCYVEWKARWPINGKGMFPALWLYHQPPAGGGDDGKGRAEMDVLEIMGVPNQWSSGIHAGTNAAPVDLPFVNRSEDTAGWHTYGWDWQPGYLKLYRDGVLLYTLSDSNAAWFDCNMGIIINFAMDAPWFGSNASDGTTPSPMTMEIDYVRVYTSKP